MLSFFTCLLYTSQFKEDTYIPEGDVAVKISLTGLKGGHSGVDIHLGRANANKLMFRFLKEAVRDYGARLSSVDGGSLRNAIPVSYTHLYMGNCPYAEHWCGYSSLQRSIYYF